RHTRLQGDWSSDVCSSDLGRLHIVMLYDCRTVGDRDRGIEAAIDAVKRGDLVVLPTDTLYGIGADAFKPWAVTALLEAKGRDRQDRKSVVVGKEWRAPGPG